MSGRRNASPSEASAKEGPVSQRRLHATLSNHLSLTPGLSSLMRWTVGTAAPNRSLPAPDGTFPNERGIADVEPELPQQPPRRVGQPPPPPRPEHPLHDARPDPVDVPAELAGAPVRPALSAPLPASSQPRPPPRGRGFVLPAAGEWSQCSHWPWCPGATRVRHLIHCPKAKKPPCARSCRFGAGSRRFRRAGGKSDQERA